MTLDEIKKRAESGPNCFLYREALENNWINPEVQVRSSGIWFSRRLNDTAEQWRSWLCESLATAIDHPDPLIRCRATLQAYEYMGRLREKHGHPGARYADALIEARNKLEAFIKGIAP